MPPMTDRSDPLAPRLLICDVLFTGTLRASTSNGSVTVPVPDETRTYRLHVGYVKGLISLTKFTEISRPPVAAP